MAAAMHVLWFVLAGLGILAVAVMRRRRKQGLARLRGLWGQPIERARRVDAMAASHQARIAVLGGHSLDQRTWGDLNLDDVFAAIDRTHSTLGQHALYHRLRTTPVSDDLTAFEALVQRMSDDATARARAQIALARLQDPHGYNVWWLASPGAVERRRWFAMFPVLTAAALVLAVLAPFWSALVPPLVIVLLVNLGVRYRTDFTIGPLASGFRQCAPLITAAQSLQFLAGDAIDPIVRPFRTDVPSLGRLKVISRWVSGNPLMLDVNEDPLVLLASDVVAAIYEYLNLAFLLDATGVYFATRDLSRHGRSLAIAVAAAGDVDAAISVASFRAGRSDWTRPLFRPTSVAEWVDLRHPLLGDGVPNSLDVHPGRGVLITGTNMSGKSTFLRTVGVNAILAQTINTCLARTYSAPVFHVRSCIGRADDLIAGKSYYLVEVEALLQLVRASDDHRPHLFLLDELFRGTAAVERIAAGHAVLQQLLRTPEGLAKPHVVLAATHDHELVDLASAAFGAYHFADSIGPDGLDFDYRLKPGPVTTRNALALLRLYGAPDALLNQAVTTAERLEARTANSEPR